MEEIFYDAADVAKLLGISKSKAYTVTMPKKKLYRSS